MDSTIRTTVDASASTPSIAPCSRVALGAARRRGAIATAIATAAGVALISVAVMTGATVYRWSIRDTPVMTSPVTSPGGSPAALHTLTDQEGARFSFAALAGRTVVMNFLFTHCAVSCPMQTKAMVALQRGLPEALRGHVHFVSVSMDPARDTPSVLKRYATALSADLASWSFVTGDEREIDWLSKYYNLQAKKQSDGQIDHRVIVFLLDARGQLMQKFTGDLDLGRIVQEIGDVDRLNK